MKVCFDDSIQFGKEKLIVKSRPGTKVVPARTGIGVQDKHILSRWNSVFFFFKKTLFSEWKKSQPFIWEDRTVLYLQFIL